VQHSSLRTSMPVLRRVFIGWRSRGDDDPYSQWHVRFAADRLAPWVFRVPLQDASVHTEVRSSGEYLREDACFNRKRRTKPPEESDSM
jgi:hypothetical protein